MVRDPDGRLNANTLVPLGTAVVVVGAVLTAAFAGASKLAKIESSIIELRYTINANTTYRWDSNNEMAAWHEFQQINRETLPNVKIPDVPTIIERSEMSKTRRP